MKSELSFDFITRREFLAGSVAAGAGLLCRPVLGESIDKGITDIAKAIGWDAKAPGNFYFLQATDLHASEITEGALKMPDKYGGKNFADDMNMLAPAPAFLAITGDLIAMTSRDPSTWPQAEVGFARVKEKIVSRLTMPCHMIIGNNDCSPEAFQKVWPDRPINWAFDCHGVHFVGLHGYNTWKPENTNHAGILLDDAQLAWLAKDIAAAAKAKTLVLFTHETLRDLDCHRIRKQIAPILDTFGGEIWNIAGHNHANAFNMVQIGTKRVRILETLTPVGSWVPDKGAYRLIFVSDGRIAGSVLRWLTKDGEPIRLEVDGEIRKDQVVTPTLEETLRKDAVRTFMVGEEDIPLRHDISKVTDRVSNFHFQNGQSFIYRVPLESWGKTVRRLFLAARSQADFTVSFAGNDQNWLPAVSVQTKSGLAFCNIPETLLSGDVLYIRITAPEKKSMQVYGISFHP